MWKAPKRDKNAKKVLIEFNGIEPSSFSIPDCSGGAGNRTQIETGQHEIPRGNTTTSRATITGNSC